MGVDWKKKELRRVGAGERDVHHFMVGLEHTHELAPVLFLFHAMFAYFYVIFLTLFLSGSVSRARTCAIVSCIEMTFS